MVSASLPQAEMDVSLTVQWLKNRDPEFHVPMVDAVQAAMERCH